MLKLIKILVIIKNKKYIKILDKNIKENPFIIQSQLQPGFCDNLKIRNREIYYQVETLIFKAKEHILQIEL